MKEQKKPLLGLKASPKSHAVFDDESDDIFFSDSDDNFSKISLKKTRFDNQNTLIENKSNPLIGFEGQQIHKIASFDEALPKITSFLTSLDEHIIPNPYDGKLEFVPEHATSEELNEKLNNLVQGEEVVFETENINILAQVDIVKSIKDSNVNLEKYVDKNIDSRILTLINFILSKNDDMKISLYYCIGTLMEFIKSDDIIPISKLFEDFKIENVVHKMAVDLIGLFPHHPILESVLNRLSRYDQTIPGLFDLIQENDDDDDFDFDDDSFFESIQEMQQKPPPLVLQSLLRENMENPLENCQPTASKMFTVTVAEPPFTVSFSLANGSSQLSPNQFVDWVKDINSKNEMVSKTVIKKSKVECNNSTCLSGNTPRPSNISDENITANLETNEESLIDLFKFSNDSQQLLSTIPAVLPPNLFPLYYPLFQIANLSSIKPFTRGFIYPSLLESEFKAHYGLMTGKIQQVQEAVETMIKRIPKDCKTIPIVPLTTKREFIPDDTIDNENLIAALSLADYEIVLHGRSPFTLNVVSQDLFLKTQFDRNWRAQALYNFYTETKFSPYLSFRIAFALAINVAEYKPSLASSFLFEGIYIIHQSLPKLCHCDFCRSAYMLLGETLEQTDCYYYSALLFDVYFLSNPYETKYSNSIAQIAQRNRDMCRAVFHFTQSMKSFVDNVKCDEALYVSQLITSIYGEYSAFSSSINLLSCLLQRSYKIAVGSRRIDNIDIQLNKTLPPVRQLNEPFEPSPSAVNTMLTAINLADLFIKKQYFKHANALLKSLKSITNNSTFLKIIDFMISKRYLRKNNLQKFFKSLPQLEIRSRKNLLSSRVSMLSASNFDTTIATIKLLIVNYNSHKLFTNALFWSEVLIQAINKTHVKDIGYACLYRGIALANGYPQISNFYGSLSLHITFTPSMNSIAKYVKETHFNSPSEYVAETLSTLKIAICSFEKVGCLRKSVESTLLYLDVLLHYFVDPTFSGNVNIQQLELKEPSFDVQINDIEMQKLIFQPYTLSTNNIEDHILPMFKNLEANVAKIMMPVQIIYCQILSAKFSLLQNKIDNSKTKFDFAFNNIQRYFICSDHFISRDMHSSVLNAFSRILENMCLTLLFFEKEYINQHLILFDWMNDIQTMINNKNKITSNESQMPINSSIEVSISTLNNLSSIKFPDFLETIERSNIKLPNSEITEDNTITSCLQKIKANVKLFEAQKLKEDEMHVVNRELCKTIEIIADTKRRESEIKIPAKFTFDDVLHVTKDAENLVFIQHLHDSLFVYFPYRGTKKRIPYKQSQISSLFTIKSNKTDQVFKTSSSIFTCQFFEIISNYLFSDKKQKFIQYNVKDARTLFEKLGQDLFGDIINNIEEWKFNQDSNKILNKGLFGKLNGINVDSISVPSKQLLFITSADIKAIPLELMFPHNLVLRTWLYSYLLVHKEGIEKLPKVNVLRVKDDPDKLRTNCIQRSIEDIADFITSCGGTYSFSVPHFKNDGRNIILPNPLFSSNKENDYYSTKYPFGEYIDVTSNYTAMKNQSVLYVFTYTDLFEMTPMLADLIRQSTSSYFMFIPTKFLRNAFDKILEMFYKVGKKSDSFLNKREESIELIEDEKITVKCSHYYVSLLQATLMEFLGCPIPLFAPLN